MMNMDSEVERLKVLFSAFGCGGAVALIEWLALPQAQGIQSIGSGTITEPDLEGMSSLSAGFLPQSLCIGSRDGSLTPLEWFAELGEVFEQVPPEARARFDEICREFASVFNAPDPTPEEEAAFREKLR